MPKQSGVRSIRMKKRLRWKLLILVIAILSVAGPGLCDTDMSKEMDNPQKTSPVKDEDRPPEKEITTPVSPPAPVAPVEVDTLGKPGVPEGDDLSKVPAAPAGEEPVQETFGQRLDRYHDNFYVFFHRKVERVNGWFVPEGKEPSEVPPSRWLMGLPVVLTLEPDNSLTTEVPFELDADFRLPDANLYKIYITTTDPGELPGNPLPQRDTSLRVGVAKSFHEYFSTSLGVKIKNPPTLNASISADTVFERGSWMYYPHQKIYWDSKDKEGEITSFIADRWVNSWDTRFTSSLRWTRDKMDSDKKDKNGEHGWLWDFGLIFGYAKELLQEPDVVRLMGGKDLARGAAIRLGILGAPWSRHVVSAKFLHKNQLRARWIYYYVEPELQWSLGDNWKKTIILTCGIEAIFWGVKEK